MKTFLTSKFKILIILSIICLISSKQRSSKNTPKKESLFNLSPIPLLNDKNFESIVKRGKDHPFLIIFTVKRCKKCDMYIETFENATKYLENEIPYIKFGKIDCYSDSWTAMRFNITSLPRVVYVDNNTYAHMTTKNFTYDNIVQFALNKDKDFRVLPRPLGYIDIANIVMDGLNTYLVDYMDGYGINWYYFETILLVIFVLFGSCYLNIKLVNCCKKKKDPKKSKNDKYDHDKCSHSHTKTKKGSKKKEKDD